MIKNIIFDIGDVLVRADVIGFIENKGYSRGIATEIMSGTFLSDKWKELDRGVMCYNEIVNSFVKNLPHLENEVRHIFNDMHGFIQEYSYTRDWIKALKADGMRVYCLSNLSDKLCTDCDSELGFLDLTDGYILSYREKLIKPDPRIYSLILERFNLTAHECVFVDDVKANVSAATELGIKGILFKGFKDANKKLKELILSSE